MEKMMKVNIVYWSGTGNTAAMAELIEEGAKSAGADVISIEVGIANETQLEADVLVLGCPSMGAEELEDSEFEPYISSIEGKLSGKKIALFGSYGWGDGEWMRTWTERMNAAGANLTEDGLIVNDKPEGDSAAECVAFGKAIAS
jgi:flavodoxin short chain